MAESAAVARGSGLRRDIEGLRALAIGLVLAFHAGIRFIPGGYVGVDVFFVISGFLITGLLVREAQRSGRVSLVRFYARRAKRLLPIASVVLVFAAIVTTTLLPRSDARIFGGDIVGAALYVVNWVLAGRSVDYLASDVGQSPVLHYWSLSVEEQFYLVWPLVIIVALLVVRRFGTRLRPTLAIGLMLVTVPSLAWSIVLTGRQDASAFFVTTTRLWELGVGALLAIAATRLGNLPTWVRQLLAAVGAAAVGYAALAFSATTPWPGYHALVPVLGTAAIIAAGVGSDRAIISRFLGLAPFVWIGGLSYSLYLWHWPLLIAATDGLGLTGARWGIVVIVASVIPAWLGHVLIENPVRFSQRVSSRSTIALLVGATCSLFGVIAGLTVTSVSAAPRTDAATTSSILGPFGAAALGTDPTSSVNGVPRDHYEAMIPAPEDSARDFAASAELGCSVGPNGADLVPCETGDLNGSVRVIIAGDSKLAQWYDAFTIIGQTNGWHVTMYSKSACPFSAAVRVRDEQPWKTCVDWNAALLDAMIAAPPDLFITSQGSFTGLLPENFDTPVETERDALAGLERRWSELVSAGIPVIALSDNPRAPNKFSSADCLPAHPDDATACSFPQDRAVATSAAPTQRIASEATPGTAFVDVQDYICPQPMCAPVIGNVVVYRDGAHITNTYAVSLSYILADRLAAAAAALGVGQ